MSAAPLLGAPLWSRALGERSARLVDRTNRGARARLALQAILERAGYRVPLVTIHTWSRHAQGRAYLWAWAFVEGREDLPAPDFVEQAVQ